MVAGVYSITSKIKPHRVYVGSSICVDSRFGSHLCGLRKGRHCNRKLQRHYDVYGEDDLIFKLVRAYPVSELIRREQWWMDRLQPYFNLAPTAGSQLGLRHSDETRHKISKAKKGNNQWYGRKHKASSKAKMRAAKLGRKLSEETRAKLSLVRMGNRNTIGNKNRLGKSFTKEARQQISVSLKRYYAEKRKGQGHGSFAI